LLVVGVVSVGLVFVADDVTWRAVWIGVASTVLVAALVDGSALYEARRRERAVLRVAGERTGRVHGRLLAIIRTVFDVRSENDADLAQELRQLNQASIDLTVAAPAIAPPRSKLVWVLQCVHDIDEALDVAVSLGVQTSEAWRFEELDGLRVSDTFMWFSRQAEVTPRVKSGGELIAAEAADCLDLVQRRVRFFASQAGSEWRHGQL
jgi:hypothetical protein